MRAFWIAKAARVNKIGVGARKIAVSQAILRLDRRRTGPRRYAKRQVAWFRNQMKDWPWAAAEAEVAIERQFVG
jgi:tRNA A37 N6-isopentenylltransferase MiaA